MHIYIGRNSYNEKKNGQFFFKKITEKVFLSCLITPDVFHSTSFSLKATFTKFTSTWVPAGSKARRPSIGRSSCAYLATCRSCSTSWRKKFVLLYILIYQNTEVWFLKNGCLMQYVVKKKVCFVVYLNLSQYWSTSWRKSLFVILKYYHKFFIYACLCVFVGGWK